MGMFRSPYDRGGVLSAEAQQERKKIYQDARAEEVRKREKVQLFLLYLAEIPPMLLPGFLAGAAVSHTALLLLPYALEVICVITSGITLFQYGRLGKEIHGMTYKSVILSLQMRVMLSLLGGGTFLVLQCIWMILHRRNLNGAEGAVLLAQLIFTGVSTCFAKKVKQTVRNWTL